jgi:hypothetical protein
MNLSLDNPNIKHITHMRIIMVRVLKVSPNPFFTSSPLPYGRIPLIQKQEEVIVIMHPSLFPREIHLIS